MPIVSNTIVVLGDQSTSVEGYLKKFNTPAPTAKGAAQPTLTLMIRNLTADLQVRVNDKPAGLIRKTMVLDQWFMQSVTLGEITLKNTDNDLGFAWEAKHGGCEVTNIAVHYPRDVA